LGELFQAPSLLVARVLELLHGTDRVAREAILRGRFRREEVAMYQFFKRTQYLRIGATCQGVAEVFAVDLAVSEEGAEAGVEDAGGRGERERPDLRLVPELSDPHRVMRASPASVVEKRYLRQFL
jgi:hypothetical protein